MKDIRDVRRASDKPRRGKVPFSDRLQGDFHRRACAPIEMSLDSHSIAQIGPNPISNPPDPDLGGGDGADTKSAALPAPHPDGLSSGR